MLQTLEREPQDDLTTQIFDTSPAPGRQPRELMQQSSVVSLDLCCLFLEHFLANYSCCIFIQGFLLYFSDRDFCCIFHTGISAIFFRKGFLLYFPDKDFCCIFQKGISAIFFRQGFLSYFLDKDFSKEGFLRFFKWGILKYFSEILMYFSGRDFFLGIFQRENSDVFFSQ